MKTLVTGGAGFIGSAIVALLLKSSHSVTVLDNISSGYRVNVPVSPKVKLVEGTIGDLAMLKAAAAGAEVIFNLAASVGNLRSINNPVEDSMVNVVGTLNVLEAARAVGVRKVVHSSSAAIFGELRQLPIKEDHPVEPDAPYGVSKLAGEKHCLCYQKLYGFEVVCLRYFNVYGVNQRYDAYGNVIPIFAHRLLADQSLIVYGDGEQTRDFVNVGDVARANLQAAQATGVSGAFNLGSGRSISINQLAMMMQEAGGKRVSVEHAPPRKGDVRHSRADISAAQSAFGFIPQVKLAEGLKEYMAWSRADLTDHPA
jgi:UDP-glucose 4-epimerase